VHVLYEFVQVLLIGQTVPGGDRDPQTPLTAICGEYPTPPRVPQRPSLRPRRHRRVPRRVNEGSARVAVESGKESEPLASHEAERVWMAPLPSSRANVGGFVMVRGTTRAGQRRVVPHQPGAQAVARSGRGCLTVARSPLALGEPPNVRSPLTPRRRAFFLSGGRTPHLRGRVRLYAPARARVSIRRDHGLLALAALLPESERESGTPPPDRRGGVCRLSSRLTVYTALQLQRASERLTTRPGSALPLAAVALTLARHADGFIWEVDVLKPSDGEYVGD